MPKSDSPKIKQLERPAQEGKRLPSRNYKERSWKERERPAFHKLYRQKRWRRLRHIILAREPMCRTCKEEGRAIEATEVDHVIPFRLYEGSFYDSSNLAPICSGCHVAKSARGL